MNNLGTSYRKYQFMEANLQRRMTGLNEKIPDIKKTLDTVKFLQLRKVRQALIARNVTDSLTKIIRRTRRTR
jgi:hypothetical protein